MLNKHLLTFTFTKAIVIAITKSNIWQQSRMRSCIDCVSQQKEELELIHHKHPSIVVEFVREMHSLCLKALRNDVTNLDSRWTLFHLNSNNLKNKQN